MMATSLTNRAGAGNVLVKQQLSLYSHALQREVACTLLLPTTTHTPWKVLILNDGQEFDALKMPQHFQKLAKTGRIQPTMLVAIHAHNRLQEYGVAGQPDYKNRGAAASQYTHFVTSELWPFISQKFPISNQAAHHFLAGCSLGGLSAFDIAWNHPQIFGGAGVFSGSFWWRKKALDDGYTDADRIAHHMVRLSKPGKKLRFWFEAGTDDETADRNSNGIIDSIEDTLDLMTELMLKGFELHQHLAYVEVKGGKHDQATWAMVMPQFLEWALK
jgi:enterochelin esterase-like enzyme